MMLRALLTRWFRRPGLAAAAVTTFALGVGGVTAIGSVANAVLLRPLPWRAPQELVDIYLVHPTWRQLPAAAALWDRGGLFWQQFVDVQAHSDALAAVGAFRPARPTLGGDAPEAVQAMYVSGTFLPMLGVAPAAGRGFDNTADVISNDEVLIAAEAAVRRFGGISQALDARIVLDGRGRTIVGVIPSPFRFDPDHDAPEFFLPFGTVPLAEKGTGVGVYYTVARLRPGVSAAQASAEIEPIVRGTFSPVDLTTRVVSLNDDQIASSRRPLWLLFGGAVLLLAIAILNVSALLVSDAEGRRLELSIRQALGATRLDLVRLLVADAFWLAFVGGVLASGLAAWLIPLLAELAPTTLLRGRTVVVDLRVLVGALVVSGAAGILACGWPAMTASRHMRTVRTGSRGSTSHASQHVLVASQVALAVILLVGVSLFAESLARLSQQPLGFEAADLTVVTTRPAESGAMTWQDSQAVEATLRRLPGVVAAAGVANAPFASSTGVSMGLAVDGPHGRASAEADLRVVTAAYFSTVRLPILRGRGFSPNDTPGGHVVVVSNAFNDRFFNGDGIGRHVLADDIWWSVVGVAGDVRQRSFREPAGPALYLLDRQATSPRTATEIRQYVVRSAQGKTVSATDVSGAFRQTSPSIIATAVTPMETLLDRSVSDERFRAELATAFGAVALALAAVGLFGLLSRSVGLRRREIGIRMALGARPAQLVGMVFVQGGKWVTVGLAVGLPLSVGLARFTSGLLFGVTPGAPHTFVAVTAVLASAAGLSMIGPARRASRVDPMLVLSGD